MQRRIEKKTWPDMFKKIKDGSKNFDVRLADFDANKNDILVLKEWNPETKTYTGRTVEKKISFVLSTKEIKYWPKEEIEKKGLLIMALSDI